MLPMSNYLPKISLCKYHCQHNSIWVSGVSVIKNVRKQGICVFSIDNHVNHFPSLVSTCERLSAMQGLPESGKAKFVLKLARTPYSGIWSRIPHPRPLQPRKWKSGQIFGLALWVLTTTEHSPKNLNLVRSWHFEFWLLQNIPLKI